MNKKILIVSILIFSTFIFIGLLKNNKPKISLDPTSPYEEYSHAKNIKETYRGVPTHILNNLIQSESSWRYQVVNKSNSEHSVGLAQINMKWFEYFKHKYNIQDPYNPYQSLNFAADYLKDLYKETGSWEKAVIAYKVGLNKLHKAPAWVKKLAKKIVQYE